MLVLTIAAALSAASPMTVEEAREVIMETCVAEGASQAECACGYGIAEQEMTERQLVMFAELRPYFDAEDPMSALPQALTYAESLGYTPEEVADAITIAFDHAERVEKTCSEEQ